MKRKRLALAAIGVVGILFPACNEPETIPPPEKERDNRPGIVETPREEEN